MKKISMRGVLSAALLLSLAGVAHGQFSVVPATRVVQVGDPVPGWIGWSVASLNTPFTDTNGVVGFTGSISGETTIHFVWYDDGIIWLNSDAAPAFVLSGAEDTSGVGSGGAFIYSPSITPQGGGSSTDGLWAHTGYIARGTDPVPGVEGLFFNALSRPTMFGTDTAAIVSTTATSPGGATTGRALLRWNPADGLSVVFKTGDVVFPAPDDFPVAVAAPTIAFTYDYSDNGQHHVHHLGLVTGSTANDAYVYKDGLPLMREGSPVPFGAPGEVWENFSGMSVNNDGVAIVFGDTSAPAAADAFLAVENLIVIREGNSTVAGVDILSASSCQGASINNLGQVVHVWNVGNSSNRIVFLAPVTDLLGGCVLVRHNDLLDLDGDGVGDRVVTNIQVSQISSPGLDFADDGYLFLRVTTTDLAGGDSRVGIFRFVASCDTGGCDPDFNGDGNVDQDDIACLSQVVAGDPSCSDADPDFNGDGNVDQDDIDALSQVVAGAECP
mgnify:CR=1 FL=1|jgi:hypothetical protein